MSEFQWNSNHVGFRLSQSRIDVLSIHDLFVKNVITLLTYFSMNSKCLAEIIPSHNHIPRNEIITTEQLQYSRSSEENSTRGPPGGRFERSFCGTQAYLQPIWMIKASRGLPQLWLVQYANETVHPIESAKRDQLVRLC